jgi:hypothetical protein
MIGGILAKVISVAVAIFSQEAERNRGAQAALVVVALFGVAAWLVRRAKI